MNKKSSSMVNMPAPREPINQKIDTNNALVLNHNAIYEQRLAEITQSNTCDKAIVTVNPYGTAPLSLYLGVWMDEAAALEINVVDSEATTEEVRYQYDVHPGANLIPVCGMVSAVNNQITLRLASQIVGQYTVMTDALPPTDSANVSLGFPIISVSCPAQQASLMEEGLYFSTYFDRYNLAFDHNGIVRWYVSQEIPSYNFVRMDNGHFLATS